MPVLDRSRSGPQTIASGLSFTFVLHDVEGHEHEEIAKILGVAVGTSKSHLHKARMKLRRLKEAKPRNSSQNSLRHQPESLANLTGESFGVYLVFRI